MTRLLEFQASEEEAIVARILVQVHKAVDEHFPNRAPRSRRFAKTLFTDTDPGETTQNKILPTTDAIPPPPPPPFGMPPPPLPPVPDAATAVTKEQVPITAPGRRVASPPVEAPKLPSPPQEGTSLPPNFASTATGHSANQQSAAKGYRGRSRKMSSQRLILLGFAILIALGAAYYVAGEGIPPQLHRFLKW